MGEDIMIKFGFVVRAIIKISYRTSHWKIKKMSFILFCVYFSLALLTFVLNPKSPLSGAEEVIRIMFDSWYVCSVRQNDVVAVKQ